MEEVLKYLPMVVKLAGLLVFIAIVLITEWAKGLECSDKSPCLKGNGIVIFVMILAILLGMPIFIYTTPLPTDPSLYEQSKYWFTALLYSALIGAMSFIFYDLLKKLVYKVVLKMLGVFFPEAQLIEPTMPIEDVVEKVQAVDKKPEV